MAQKNEYCFDRQLDRRGMSTKWDEPPYGADPAGMVPMWIADMDFATPPCVTEAISKRLAHPTMGYFSLDSRFYDAIIQWQRSRRGVCDLLPEMLHYQNSTVGGMSAAVKMLTGPGDPVLVNQPNYTGFTYGVEDAGRRLVLSPLRRDAHGVFRMDFEDMEEKIQTEKISCAILCSPHNPTGRVWSAQELRDFSALCEKYQLKVIVDEIWADFVFAPHRLIPVQQATAYLRENCIAFSAPTKCFNLAGLRVAYSIIYGKELRERFHKFCEQDHYNVPNVLSAEALIGGYSGGETYVDALVAYIRGNQEYAMEEISKELPAVGVYLPEGTYTMWLDMHKTGRSDEENIRRLIKAGVVPNAAQDYNDSGFIRMNMACPRSQVQEALKRFITAMKD